MTKAEEIEKLQKFTAKLPKDTYLFAWLTAVLPRVADDIKCDIIPAFTPQETRKQVAVILDEANARAKEMMERADKYAKEVEARAQARVEAIMGNAYSSLNQAMKELQK